MIFERRWQLKLAFEKIAFPLKQKLIILDVKKTYKHVYRSKVIHTHCFPYSS